MISPFPNNPALIHRVIVGSILFITPIFVSASCAKRSITTSNHTEISKYSYAAQHQARINVNTASARELEALPGIGKGLAERIVEHRQKYGPFGRPEHLIMVRGISEKRFIAMRDQITVE
jgi:competence protein ComEA